MVNNLNTGVNLIPSGFSFIDENWGGLYLGGSYLLVGPRKSGRTLLGLQLAYETAKSSEVCLYFTNMRPKDLMIHAASLNFDIKSYMDKNLIIVVRMSPPNEVYQSSDPDGHLIEYLNDIITVVNQYNPARVIFDELTPYIGFKNLGLLNDAFLHTLESIEELDITSIFLIGEPATVKANSILDIISQSVTGLFILKKTEEILKNRFHGGTLKIIPNVGHTEGIFSTEYKIRPNKGVYIDSSKTEKLSSRDELTSLDRTKEEETTEETISINNEYNYNDFLLLLNNQIAMFRSTGQFLNLAAIRLDPAAQVNGLLSFNQLKNAISKTVDKKDKLCVIDNNILILIVRSRKDSIEKLINGIKNNLPSTDQNYISAIEKYISLRYKEVNELTKNADDMVNFILSDDESIQNKFENISDL